MNVGAYRKSRFTHIIPFFPYHHEHSEQSTAPRCNRELFQLFIRYSKCFELEHLVTHLEHYHCISSMAQARNRPGAGRTLGLLYDFLGLRIEVITNRLFYAWRYGSRTPWTWTWQLTSPPFHQNLSLSLILVRCGKVTT